MGSDRNTHGGTEELRREVGPVGPNERAELGINTELAKEDRVFQWLEYRPMNFISKIYLPLRTVAEPKPDDKARNMVCIHKMGNHSITPRVQFGGAVG